MSLSVLQLKEGRMSPSAWNKEEKRGERLWLFACWVFRKALESAAFPRVTYGVFPESHQVRGKP